MYVRRTQSPYHIGCHCYYFICHPTIAVVIVSSAFHHHRGRTAKEEQDSFFMPSQTKCFTGST